MNNIVFGRYFITPIIYLAPFFVSLFHLGAEICLTIILMSVFVFLVSWLIVFVLSKIPVVGKYCT